jgi:hypothetical protein
VIFQLRWARKDSIGRVRAAGPYPLGFNASKLKKNKGLFATVYLAETCFEHVK